MAIYHDLDNTGQEVQQRLDQVPVTQADLAEEVLSRQAAVGAVQNNVDAEELRAKAAEKLNADDIDAIEEKIPSGASSSNKMATASDISSLDAAIEAILLLIPSAATSLNKLADKAFVNSSIATATATFRGTKNLVSDLNLAVDATHEQIAVALSEAVSGADNNDYAFVQVPTSSGTPTEIRVTERYKFDGTAWSYEYDLNNSGFTSDQWAAINSTITSGLVDKLNALPSNADLTAALGILTNGIAAINEKIPTAATSSNKLVDTAAMQSYITQILDGIDATFNVTSTDGHVTIQVTQVNGVVTNVAVTTSDIASAADVAQLFQLYNALSQSEPEIIQPADTWPLANPSTTVIYRVIDRVNTPPQNYSDYMFSASDLTTPVLMATYNNAIDPRPKKGSQNLVTSGGVFDNMGALDVSELNATENPHTPAIYADLSAALAAITSDYQKGGMSIKFVQGSVQSNDNKYVQYRLMSDTFNTTVANWQGVDDIPTVGSENLVKSGGIKEEFDKVYDYTHNLVTVYDEIENCANSQICNMGTYAVPNYVFTEASKLRYILLGIQSNVNNVLVKFFTINNENVVTKILKEVTIEAGLQEGVYKFLIDDTIQAGDRVGIWYGGPNNSLNVKGFGNTSQAVGFSNGNSVNNLNVGITLSLSYWPSYCYCLGYIVDEGEKSETPYESPFKDKTIVFIGDSFMDGGAGHSFSNQYSVVKQIVENEEIGSWYNFALGGACFCCDENTVIKQTEVRSELYGDGPYPAGSGIGGSNVIINQVNRLIALVNNNEISEPDMVVVMAGTNDRVPVAYDANRLGSVQSAFSVTDISSYTLPQLNTVALGVRGTIELLINTYPNAIIVVSTPCYLKNNGAADINEVIEGVCEYMGVGCFKAWKECGVNVRYGNHFPDIFLHDGLHPNVLGAKKIANYLLGKMKQLSSIN